MKFSMKVIGKRFQLHTVKISLSFSQIDERVLILFNLPSSLKNIREKSGSIAFRKSDSLMIVANQNGYIEDANDLTVDFFGLPRDHFIGKKCEEIFNLFSNEVLSYQEFKCTLIKEGRAETVQQYVHSSEDLRYYKITSFYDEDSHLFLTRINDYTERTMLKRNLDRKDSLSEVGQLAASIAHEIRNPMTTLKGFTQLLKATATDETLKYLAVIDDEILRMESILSEMLFLAKPNIQEKKLVSFKKLLDDIINVIYPKATFEGIAIIQRGQLSTNSSIYGEEGKLKQVLLNLLKNGMESMGPGGTLTISIEEQKNQPLNIIIEDTGKGMNDSQLDQIFSPYFTTRSDGTGLGLPFVLKTIEDHGGTISVSSEVGVGSKFTLSFPQIDREVIIEKCLAQSV